MRYLVCDNKDQLIYVSSGQLLSENHFIHPRRNLDTWVIIICTNGTLYISQGGRNYTLTENQYIILFSGHEHYGFKKSNGNLSYYWCHFKIRDKYDIIKHEDLIRSFGIKTIEHNSLYNKELTGKKWRLGGVNMHFSEYYILPETGDISSNGRAVVIFRQLLDLARKDSYSQMLPNCALSLLAMEFTQEFIESSFQKENRLFNPKMEKIIEWIRVNYSRHHCLDDIAKVFNYNSDYLSTAFRRYTGIPMMKYINTVRISNAKIQLLNTPDVIKEIAWRTGFEDEKSFMKRFKQIEGITPTTYRNAFTRTKIVK